MNKKMLAKRTTIVLFFMVMTMMALMTMMVMMGRARATTVNDTRGSNSTSCPPAPPPEFTTYSIVPLNATNITLVSASYVVTINASAELPIDFTYSFTLYNPGESIELDVALPFMDELPIDTSGGNPFTVTANGTMLPHEFSMNSTGSSIPSQDYSIPWWFQQVRCHAEVPANASVVLEFQMNPAAFYVEYSRFSHVLLYAPVWTGNGTHEINVTIYHAVPDGVYPLNNQTSSNAYQTSQIPGGEYHSWRWIDGFDFNCIRVCFGEEPVGGGISPMPRPTPHYVIIGWMVLATCCTIIAPISWAARSRARKARSRPTPATNRLAPRLPPRYCKWCGTLLSWEPGMRFCPTCGGGVAYNR